VLWYQRIFGDPDMQEVWDELDDLLSKEWIRQDGLPLTIHATAIDSGFQGSNKQVYEYCRKRKARRVRAIKGNGRYGAKLFVIYKAHNKTLDVVHIGTNEAKATLYEKRLGVSEPGPRYIHFNDEVCDIEYFSQLTAEQGVKKNMGMVSYVVYEKKKHGIRNEALDTYIYAYVMMVMALPNWESIAQNLKTRLETRKPDRKKTEPELKEEKLREEKPITRVAPVHHYPRPRGFVSRWR
jgi:phage terminase large subunit GpA-like protein